LKPGGRFVAEFGGGDNVAQIRAALWHSLQQRGVDPIPLDPWYFPSLEEYQAKLTDQGFEVGSITLIPRPTPLPGDIIGWLETFAESFSKVIPAADRPAFLEEIRATLQPQLCDAEGNWTADYVRLRFAANKPDD
jgi:hypothetical protein